MAQMDAYICDWNGLNLKFKAYLLLHADANGANGTNLANVFSWWVRHKSPVGAVLLTLMFFLTGAVAPLLAKANF